MMTNIRKLAGGLLMVVLSLSLSVGAFATDSSGSLDTVKTGMVTGLTAASASIMDVLGSILPIALGILAAVLVITIGIRVFRRVTGR